MKYLSGSLMITCLLLATISACSSSRIATPIQTPDTYQTPSVSAIGTSIDTPSKSPTPIPEIKITPTLIPPLDNWDKMYISRIPAKDMAGATPEEIVEKLVTQWLEFFMTSPQDNFKIEGYQIRFIRIEKNFTSPIYEIIATVGFDVNPMNQQSVWVVDAGTFIGDGWVRTGRTFGILHDGEYYRLKNLPGWGT